MTEHNLHVSVASYLNLVLQPGTWWTSIPAGDGGGYVRGAKWKARGAVKGVPDVLLVRDSRAFWIELKTEKGRLSDAQEDCHEALKLAGASVAICRSLDDVRQALKMWHIETREMA